MRTHCKVKICGLTRRRDVELAVELGAEYVGFVLAPASPRHVPPELLPAAAPHKKHAPRTRNQHNNGKSR